MNYYATLILCVWSFVSFSQQVKLNGRVSIHNSKYNTGKTVYVKLAYITAPYTKPATTDDNGRFELEFVGIAAGTAVKVQVEKPGLEVVNDVELQQVIIDRQLPLQIYMTTKGQLAMAQTEFYNISKKALFAQKDALIARLYANDTASKVAIAELEKRFGRAIADRYEAEKLLNEKVEAMEKRLPEFAQNLAIQNLDVASDLYIAAYEAFKKGNIEKAIEVLDDATLEQSYKEALENLVKGKTLVYIGKDLQEKGRIQLDQIINSYELKAEAFNVLFKYNSVAQLYEKIIEIYKVTSFDKEKLAIYYSKAAGAYYEDGKYKTALDYQQKIIDIQEKILDPKNASLAVAYNNIAITYKALGNHEKALSYHQKVIDIWEQILNPRHASLAVSYNNVALTYQVLEEYEKALDYQLKSVGIQEKILKSRNPDLANSYNNMAGTYRIFKNHETDSDYQKNIDIQEECLDPQHPGLVTSYNNIPNTYQVFGNHETALSYQQKDIDIQEKILDYKYLDFTISYTFYSNIALAYQALGGYETALNYQQKAIEIQEKILDAKHPSLATAYGNIALIYQALGKYDAALDYQQRCIKIQEEILDAKHPSLATAYGNIALIYQALEKYDAALDYQQRCIKIQEEILNPKHPDLMTSYNNIAFTYEALGNYATALDYQQKAIKIREEILDAKHPDLVESARILPKRFLSLTKIVQSKFIGFNIPFSLKIIKIYLLNLISV